MSRFGTRIIYFFIGLFGLFASACTNHNYAPVTDLRGMEALPKTGLHRVAKGETLYEIAWRYGLDYRVLAERNNIKPPYKIQQHQMINLNANKHVVSQPARMNTQHTPKVSMAKIKSDEKEPNYSASGWVWPASGKIINAYSVTNKGINIAGQEGEPIYAAAAGKVVYSGNGLRGYGNLIIIKHNSVYLSAYAHTKQSFVKDGDWVKNGQKIAQMGRTGTDKTMLHFEIRRAGKPVNPLSFYQQGIA